MQTCRVGQGGFWGSTVPTTWLALPTRPAIIEREAMPKPEVPIVIKRYASWRLHNTGTAAYMSLEHLAGMVRQGEYFVVLDSRSGEDITRSVVALITSPTTTEH
jgi:PHB/PHA accumulation regulator DNA-binding domain